MARSKKPVPPAKRKPIKKRIVDDETPHGMSALNDPKARGKYTTKQELKKRPAPKKVKRVRGVADLPKLGVAPDVQNGGWGVTVMTDNGEVFVDRERFEFQSDASTYQEVVEEERRKQ